MILVILAAGLGSRYGGAKQVDAIGPKGEWIMDFSIRDALAAGFTRVVVVCRDDFRPTVAEHLAAFHPGAAIDCVVQGPRTLVPESVASRERPWGTGHALCAAADAIDAPCCVINADDCYGAQTFVVAMNLMSACDEQYGGLVAFRLAATLSEHGGVSRGICTVADELLVSVAEHHELQRDGEQVHGRNEVGEQVVLPLDTPCSLNTWCLHPAHVDALVAGFRGWIAEPRGEREEYQLPTSLNGLMHAGKMRIRTGLSPERWYGVTYREDREAVRQHLAG